MATTTSITTTYAGEAAGKYIAASVLSGNTLAQGGISIMPNIKYKSIVKRLNLSGLVANGTCDFTPTGTVATVERVLTPKELQVNLDLCKKDFRSDWEAVSMGYSAFDQLPKTFADFLIAHMGAKIAEATENNIWTTAAGAGAFSSFSQIVAADAALPAAQEVAGTTVTASNVITELGKIADAIPSTLYGREDLHIYIPQNIARAYVRALGGFGASGLGSNGVQGQGTMWYNGMPELNFDGIKLFVANGLASNKAIATTKDNLWFGTGLLNDQNEVRVIDMADIDGSQNVRFVMRYTAGVQYGVVEDIVTYGITNGAN